MVDAQEIVTRLGIDYQKMSLIRSFGNNSIIYQCIIYCVSIKECENLLTNLQAKVRKEVITMYHGELSAKEKSNALSLWKSGKIQIIVATNAFGMGINEPDVRVVIHAGFLMSMGNGRAGRDGLPAKAIIMFSQKDIRTVMGVYSGGKDSNSILSEEGLEASNRIKYLSDAKYKIREVLFYCSTVYQCRKQAISNYFAWPGDPVSQECTLCDNCIRRATDNPVYIDV
ncbi:hypothetical protein RclHR1_20650002 [Rhizophagus clarus]|uniref:DNA 3'-5' helicase n=1 Tax=Rhizophagus clarus TaxID=94130 RepID=A0A2Z6R4Y6_9GLOM|nr:hypothetical protein RclHR1_20650002 [Rhizophagus clarus]